MRKAVILAVLLSLPAGASAGLLPKPRTYRAFDMFDNGYKHSVQKDGTWRIIANARPLDGRGFAQEMALYRAAELTRESGHTHFQILDATGSVGTGLYVRGRETTRLIVRPSNDASPPLDCRSRSSHICVTVEAEPLIARIGPTLHK
jgi:hypothetical protein